MAEKIDKNEYVDNSKVFFDFLLHTHQWSNITPVEYAKWLSNFNDIPDGQYIACRLLNRFLYYSDKDIKKLLVDAINDVYSQQVVLEGGRGTGKSTVFLCNCWRNQLAAAENDPAKTIDSFLNKKSVGLYYKVDGAFLSAMDTNSRALQESTGIFNTYLSVELCKELFSYFAAISTRKNIIGDVEYQKIQKAYNRSVRTTPANNLLCFEDLIDDCDNILNAIEDCINYGEQITDSLIFRITSAGSIFKSVVEEILKLAHFSDVTFRVFIDEFESLCEWQQKQVNTLIKQSNSYLIYNICMKINGFKTYETNSVNEIIQPTHDYKYFKFENLLETAEYKNTLKSICEKRFTMFFDQLEQRPECSTDIEFYLGNYSIDCELARFENRTLKFKESLERIIWTLISIKICFCNLLCFGFVSGK